MNQLAKKLFPVRLMTFSDHSRAKGLALETMTVFDHVMLSFTVCFLKSNTHGYSIVLLMSGKTILKHTLEVKERVPSENLAY